jgi:hypothetical protein
MGMQENAGRWDGKEETNGRNQDKTLNLKFFQITFFSSDGCLASNEYLKASIYLKIKS